jgi:hypothetical protein
MTTTDKRVSVQPDWALALPMQQQSVLFLSSRGPDGVTKKHPCKDIQRAFRATVLKAARYGRTLEYGERGDSFMCLKQFAQDEAWGAAVEAFFDGVDSLPHHFTMHLIHAAEILGYKHPDARFRIRWRNFYERGVEDLHLTPETEDEMDKRLSDWNRKEW